MFMRGVSDVFFSFFFPPCRPSVDRTMLHAYSLCFKHPFTGANVEVVSPPADDFLSCVKAIVDSYEGSSLSENQIKILSDIKSGKSGGTLQRLGYLDEGEIIQG